MKRTILILEDNELNRELLCAVLEDKYHLILAENGVEGYDLLTTHHSKIDLILTDINMPIMNGYEFLEKQQNHDLFSHIPVIVMTSQMSAEEEIKCLNLGACDFIAKPFNTQNMLARIARTIHMHESTAALNAVEIDTLTGLFSKHAFYHHAEKRLVRNQSDSYDLIILDIDRFRLLNERIGVEMGNHILKLIANSLLRITHETDAVVGRYSGDHFAILMPSGQDSTMQKQHWLIDHVKRDLLDDELTRSLHISIKMGAYEHVDHALPIELLCSRTIMALKTIRNYYGDYVAWFDNSLLKSEEERQTIEAEMQNALQKEQFQVYYQPKHHAHTGRIVGAEALVRWIHPTKGIISPGVFIPLFEENGFITPLDLYIGKIAD